DAILLPVRQTVFREPRLCVRIVKPPLHDGSENQKAGPTEASSFSTAGEASEFPGRAGLLPPSLRETGLECRAARVPPLRHFGHAPFTRSRATSFAGSTTTCFTRWRFQV